MASRKRPAAQAVHSELPESTLKRPGAQAAQAAALLEPGRPLKRPGPQAWQEASVVA